MFLPKMFLHIFHTRRSKYIQVLVKCCTEEILCTQRLRKIRGNIAGDTREAICSYLFQQLLDQWCTTSGPRATSGPRRVLMWPAASIKKWDYLVYSGAV